MKFRKHQKELLLYVLIFAVGILAMGSIDAFELFYEFSRAHEEYELDDILLSLPILLGCMLVYIWHRRSDLARSKRELEKANQQLEQANERIHQMAEANEQFMAMACHELKNPLGGLISSLRLVALSRGKEETHELVGLALKGADNLQMLIRDVLAFSQLSHEQEHGNTSPFSVREVLESVHRISLPLAEEKRLTLGLDMDENLPDLIIGNEGWLRIICLNLVGNGIKYTPTGAITIGCICRTTPAQTLVLTISDTGQGIPEKALEVIFDPYHRGTHSARDVGRGLGLGLSIVKRLLDRLGGTISVHSVVDQGSVFTVELPFE